MLFNSKEFLLFFPIVTLLFFLLPHKFRWFHLLLASCIFYMAFVPKYILILFFTIVVDYIAGIYIEQAENKNKKLLLTMSIIANVGVLAFFKYYNFFTVNINDLLFHFNSHSSIPFLKIILPIGLSFHTFQAMSYTIEVYRGNQKAEKHFGIYALYVMFYPQLVAGPIERPQNLLHQFHEKKYYDYDNAVSGLRMIMWGMVKKVVVADRLSIYTDKVFNHPHQYSGIALAFGAMFFAFQIFCDFSGYSDIALGCAKVMGFKLMVNFNRPYHSSSIGEFWKRWHISLSTWFKDYLYISLGGNRVSVSRRNYNLFVVFLVSGFWHGANWTYIIWGALHGSYVVLEHLLINFRKTVANKVGLYKNIRLNNLLNRIFCFFIVTFAWIFFRANNIKDSLYISGKVSDCFSEFASIVLKPQRVFDLFGGKSNVQTLIIGTILIILLEIVHSIEKGNGIDNLIGKQTKVVRWLLYYCAFFAVMSLGFFEKHEFIYFQF